MLGGLSYASGLWKFRSYGDVSLLPSWLRGYVRLRYDGVWLLPSWRRHYAFALRLSSYACEDEKALNGR